jgi:hypothetical protein
MCNLVRYIIAMYRDTSIPQLEYHEDPSPYHLHTFQYLPNLIFLDPTYV